MHGIITLSEIRKRYQAKNISLGILHSSVSKSCSTSPLRLEKNPFFDGSGP